MNRDRIQNWMLEGAKKSGELRKLQVEYGLFFSTELDDNLLGEFSNASFSWNEKYNRKRRI